MAKQVKKEKIFEPIEKKYPSLILGLDISTSCIGVSIVYDDGINKPEIVKITHVVPKIPSKIKGIEALILRKQIFEQEFLEKNKNIGITECVIEAPLTYSSGKSNASTVAQLLRFNTLLSESVYKVLGIIPYYIESLDARIYSFPQLMGIRKFNKKTEEYPVSHVLSDLKTNHLVPFATYPFDVDKKGVMMDLVNEMYPDIKWIYDAKGELKKENYDACDSLICALSYINLKKNGKMNEIIYHYSIIYDNDKTEIAYTVKIWDKLYDKTIILKPCNKELKKMATKK